MSKADYITDLFFTQNRHNTAISEAIRIIREYETELREKWETRFLEKRKLDNGSVKLWPVTESYISRCVDLADFDSEDDTHEFLYTEDDGSLHPVTFGKADRQNCSFVYASSNMVANGKVVGNVFYTDH